MDDFNVVKAYFEIDEFFGGKWGVRELDLAIVLSDISDEDVMNLVEYACVMGKVK